MTRLTLLGLGLLSLLVAAYQARALPQAPAPAPTPGAAPVPAAPSPTSLPDWEVAEAKTRAAEDLANLEAYLRAKAARVRESELRVGTFKDRQASFDRQKTKGMITPFLHRQGEVTVAEAEAEALTRLAEFKEVESRRDRARRRLALIEAGRFPRPDGPAGPVGPPLLSQERELDRMRSEIDDLKRQVHELTEQP